MNMNNKVVFLVVAIVFLAVVVGAFFVFRQKPVAVTSPEQMISGEEAIGNMEEIFNLGKNFKCEANTSDGQKITMYAYGQKIKVVMLMPDSEKNQLVTLYDGKTLYGWQSNQKEGTKFAINPQDYFKPAPTEAVQEDESKKLSYKCRTWVVDPHEFDLPHEIIFQDMTGIMQEAQKEAHDAAQKMCSSCGTMPAGAQQDSCKVQFCSPE